MTDPFIRRVAESLMRQHRDPDRRDGAPGGVAGPVLRAGAARSQDDVRADVKVNLGQILRGLAGLEPLDFDLARTLARRQAEQGVPVAALLHAYRVAAQVLWDHHLAAGHLLGMSEFDLDQILDGAAELWALTNTYCSVISQAYDDIATERARRSERYAHAPARRPVRGPRRGPAPLAEMSRLLDLPEREPFAVVVAEVRRRRRRGSPRRAAAAARRDAVHVAGDPSPADRRGRARCRQWLARRRCAPCCPSVPPGSVGLSPVYADLTDTSRQVSLADLAMGCVPPGEVGVTLFDEQPVGALIARSPELSERIAALVLGPVLALDADDASVLLGTLAAWIEEGGSVSKAARAPVLPPQHRAQPAAAHRGAHRPVVHRPGRDGRDLRRRPRRPGSRSPWRREVEPQHRRSATGR